MGYTIKWKAEQREQAEFVALMRRLEAEGYPQLRPMHQNNEAGFTGNGLGKHYKTKAYLLGLWPGAPDVMIPAIAFAVEFKRPALMTQKKNPCKENQLEAHEYLRKYGWVVHVCFTWQDAAYLTLSHIGWNDEQIMNVITIDGEIEDRKGLEWKNGAYYLVKLARKSATVPRSGKGKTKNT